jgi:sulfite dehydrogenase
MLNGFPLRLVVRGLYATYWIKVLFRVIVADSPFDGFLITKAYRVPNNPEGAETPDHLATHTVPINRFAICARTAPALGSRYE